MSESWKIEVLDGKETIFANTGVTVVRMSAPDIESYKRLSKEKEGGTKKGLATTQSGYTVILLCAVGAGLLFRNETLAMVLGLLFLAFVVFISLQCIRENRFVISMNELQWKVLSHYIFDARRKFNLSDFGTEFEPGHWRLMGDKKFLLLPKKE